MRVRTLSFILTLQFIVALSLQEQVTSLHLQKLSFFASGSNYKNGNDIHGRAFRRIAQICPSSSTPPKLSKSITITAAAPISTDTSDNFGSWAPFFGLFKDVKRRVPHYKSDWTDGFRKRTVGASLFLYFTCLAPVVAFGGIANLITEGSIGVIEFIVSSGLSGMIYAMLSGQPMAFLGPTGLTLAFISTLYRFSKFNNVPFLEIYSWTGIWTSMFLSMASVFNLANLLKYCTRFTDDCFNALLSINFLYEAALSLGKNFVAVNINMNKAWLSLVFAAITAISTSFTASFTRKQTQVNKRIARFVSSFGPSMVVILISLISTFPAIQAIGLDRLAVPKTFSLNPLISRRPDIFSLPIEMRLRCMVPAILLTMLFYLDQNISIRTVNGFKMKKGEAYHLDMLILAAVVFLLSTSGLPWVCGATVQSLNHVRAMANIRKDENENEVVEDIVENRLSGFLTHTFLLCSVLLLPCIGQIPVPVISGIFLYLGTKLISGNQFLERLGKLLAHATDISKCVSTGPQKNIFDVVKPVVVARYVAIQASMLTLIWMLKSTPSLSIFFPACIALLMITRVFILPSFFSDEDLQRLDSADLEL